MAGIQSAGDGSIQINGDVNGSGITVDNSQKYQFCGDIILKCEYPESADRPQSQNTNLVIVGRPALTLEINKFRARDDFHSLRAQVLAITERKPVEFFDGGEGIAGRRTLAAEQLHGMLDPGFRDGTLRVVLTDDAGRNEQFLRWPWECLDRKRPDLDVVLSWPRGVKFEAVSTDTHLRVLFMAARPEEVARPVPIERAEDLLIAELDGALKNRELQMRQLGHGSRRALEEALEHPFDVVHLMCPIAGDSTATAGAELLLEGHGRNMTAAALSSILLGARNIPKLLVVTLYASLDGPSSKLASSADIARFMEVRSALTAELMTSGLPAVLTLLETGHGFAARATGCLYKELARGQPLVRAVAKARRMARYLDEAGSLSDAILLTVQAGYSWRVEPRDAGSHDRDARVGDEVEQFFHDHGIDLAGLVFSYRPRLIQRIGDILRTGRYRGRKQISGICIVGMPGMSKSTLACQVSKRVLALQPDTRLVVRYGALTPEKLIGELVEAVKRAGDGDSAKWLQSSSVGFSERLRIFLCERTLEIPFLFILDGFEANVADYDASGDGVLADGAHSTLSTLLKVLSERRGSGSGRDLMSNLLITSHSAFVGPRGYRFADIRVGGLQSDVIRSMWATDLAIAGHERCASMGRIMRTYVDNPVDWECVANMLGSNPGVISWLLLVCSDALIRSVQKAIRGRKNDGDWARLKQLRHDGEISGLCRWLREAFMERYGLGQRLQDLSDGEREFLRRAQVLSMPVPRPDLTDLFAEPDIAPSDIERLANLGLLEVSESEPGQLVYRVSPLIVLDDGEPVASTWHKQAAGYLYLQWCGQRDDDSWGIWRLSTLMHNATKGDCSDIAEEVAVELELEFRAYPGSVLERWLVQQACEKFPDSRMVRGWMAAVHQSRGDLDEARFLLKEMLREVCATSGSLAEQAALHHRLGRLAHERGHLAQAAEHHRRAACLGRKLAGRERTAEVAASEHEQALVHLEQGDVLEARNLLTGILDDASSIVRKLSTSEERRHHEASVLTWQHTLACTHMRLGDHDRAQELLRTNIDDKIRLYGTQENAEVRTSVYELARLMLARGELEDAHKVLAQLVGIDRRMCGDIDDDGPLRSPDLADSLYERAHLHLKCGDLQRAYEDIEESLAIDREFYSSTERPEYATALLLRSSVQRARGHLDAAERDLDEACAIAAVVFADRSHPLHAAIEHERGILLFAHANGESGDRAQLESAREHLERALSGSSADGSARADTLRELGRVCVRLGALDCARNHLRAAREIYARATHAWARQRVATIDDELAIVAAARRRGAY